ncbi:insulinase family protein [Gayadomonas joobiniege]|uniref:insulinase family protein n=1 Tax=Gayadomonas joobiniege TaxID=1234606 RepID=UPI000371628C|nr:insulinase family protein [Gayadomonas joobiniege]
MIITSQHDAQTYSPITLENGLEALIVANGASKKFAVALTIATGHFQDPPEFPGLSHLLEHCLLQGSQDYPADTFNFTEQLEEFSGRVNATTSSEFTNFYFDCNIQYAKPVLAQFSRFFVCPEFRTDIVRREVNVLESEFKSKIQDEIRRLNDVHKENSNPAHPFSQFSAGNFASLMALGEDALFNALEQHFKNHITAQKIKLVIVSPWPAEKVKPLIIRHFSDIPKQKNTIPAKSAPLYRMQDLGLQFDIQPIRAIKRAIYTFAVPSEGNNYQNKSIEYLLTLFGDEGPGSLYQTLVRQDLCSTLTAACGQDDGYTLDFNLSLQLTDNGLQNINQVHHILFSYIHWLKNQSFDTALYQDKKQLNETEFYHLEPGKPIEWASMLATNMQLYPVQDWLYGPYRMDQMSPEWLNNALEHLSPHKLRLTLLSPNFKFDHISRYYQTPYAKRDFKYVISEIAPNVFDFRLPQKNPYITALTKDNLIAVETRQPDKIIDEDGCLIWFKQETGFRSPLGQIYVSVDLPNSQGNIRRHAMLRLFIEILMDELLTKSYHARAAGLNFTLSPHQGGLTFQFSGYAQNQHLLVSEILSQLCVRHLSESVFNNHKQKVINSFLDQKHIRPANALFRQLSNMLQNNQYDHSALAYELTELSIGEFAEYSVHLFERINLEALICGYWDMTQALEIANSIKHKFFSRARPCAELKRAVYAIDLGCHAENYQYPHDDNAVVAYFQAPENSEHFTALYMLFNQVLSPLVFNALRKQEQLGYLVGSSYFPLNQTPGLIVYVQSNSHDNKTIRQNIHGLLAYFPQYLTQMTDDIWYRVKKGLIHQLQEPNSTLQSSALQHWMAIGLKDTQFRRTLRIIERINQLSLADFISAAETVFLPNSDDYQCLELSCEAEKGLPCFEKSKNDYQKDRNII